jgi:hypothetical protein
MPWPSFAIVPGDPWEVKAKESCFLPGMVVGVDLLLADVPTQREEALQDEEVNEPPTRTLDVKRMIAGVQGGVQNLSKIESMLGMVRRLDVERWESEGGLGSAFGSDLGVKFPWLESADGVDEELLGAWKVRNKEWLETRSSLLAQGDLMKYTLLTDKVASLEGIREVERMENFAIELQLALAYLEVEAGRAQGEKAELAHESVPGKQKKGLGILRRRSRSGSQSPEA